MLCPGGSHPALASYHPPQPPTLRPQPGLGSRQTKRYQEKICNEKGDSHHALASQPTPTNNATHQATAKNWAARDERKLGKI